MGKIQDNERSLSSLDAENCLQENVEAHFITIDHINGKINLSDMFTKEEKHLQHFINTRDMIMTRIPSDIPSSSLPPSEQDQDTIDKNISLSMLQNPNKATNGSFTNPTVGKGVLVLLT